MIGQTEIVKYTVGVKTPAGWRSVTMTAEAIRISPKRVEVIKVTAIDGEEISCGMSRTGAKRQAFNGEYFANAEIGKKKNIPDAKGITND